MTTIRQFSKHGYDYHVFTKRHENPDVSYLGEYSNTPAEHYIDRQERGDMGRGECRYFNVDGGDPEYLELDYKRHEEYNAGEWEMLGMVCEIRKQTKHHWTVIAPRVGEASLWGIESDCGDDYIQECANELILEAEADVDALRAALNEPQPTKELTI